MDDSTRHATRLWTSAQPVVAAFVASVVRDRRDREDVLQETALAVLNSFESYDSSQAFQGWAIGVARNQISLYLRRRRRDRLVFNEETIANLQSTFEQSSPPEELDHLPTCIEQLSGRSRKICELRYQKGLKPIAISEQIGMTANSVSKALQRIREQLRECIEDKFVSEGANG